MTLEEREKFSSLFDMFQNFLTQSQKQVLHLYLIEDLGITEIGEILALSRQAVYDSLNKGKKKLLSFEKKLS